MVKSGKPVDAVIRKLSPLLEEGDTIIDGGNSHWKDTDRRVNELEKQGIHYIGCGISGGEEGARHGPSMMPGGEESSYRHVREIFEAIAAKVDGEPCVAYIGPRSAGHFVKMVHNGVEYAIMQAMAETYHLMFEAGVGHDEMHGIFRKWSNGRLGGFLMEITAEIVGHKDKTGKPFLEIVKDTAGSKGTGKWTSQTAYDMGVPVHNISSALLARILSAYKEDREQASKIINYEGEFGGNREEFIELLEQALYSAVVTSYAQGFHLLQVASKENEYNLNLQEIAKIWRGGCIIRSKLLQPIMKAYENPPVNLLLSEHFDIHNSTIGLRKVIAEAAGMGVPTPVLSHTLAYYDTLRKGRIPTAALIQAQRDFFGAHTYQRADEEGTFHTLWSGDRSEKRW